jgi:hypothetical protein
MRALLVLGWALFAVLAFGQGGPTVMMPSESDLEGITFDFVKDAVYLPVDELASELGIELDWDPKLKSLTFGGKAIGGKDVRALFDGTQVVNLFALKAMGIEIVWEEELKGYSVLAGNRFGVVTVPGQWVEVSLSQQRLRGYQGKRLIIDTKVSTGKKGFGTPVGEYKTGPEKNATRRSAKYENAPMPFAVQFYGGYYVHGSSSVPRSPASHGCVRMPLTGGNAAKFFYEWVHRGMPLSVRRDWSDRVSGLDAKDSG